MAYKGYVYHPYPRMIGSSTEPKGYRIVNSAEEEAKYTEVPQVIKPEAKKAAPKKKLMFTTEE